MKKTPVILTSFGNRKGSSEVRAYLEDRFRREFPACEFHWALGSHFLQKLADPCLPPSPEKLLRQLHEEGHEKAVIQSLHIAPAAEYYKLVAISAQAPLVVRVSLPLLACRKDCKTAALTIQEMKHLPDNTAAVLLLHGSSHQGGEIFHQMGEIFTETWGEHAFYGVLEGMPDKVVLAEKIREAGFSGILLIPFMLAPSYHLERDLLGGKNSWKAFFDEKHMQVDILDTGIGLRPGIFDIFRNHLAKTLKGL